MTITADTTRIYDVAETDLRERVEAILQGLPETPVQIAQLLHSLHVKGVCSDGYECAISELLYHETGETMFCTPDWIEVPIRNEAGFQVDHGDAHVPPHVARFMELFDDGHFPLITREDVSLI